MKKEKKSKTGKLLPSRLSLNTRLTIILNCVVFASVLVAFGIVNLIRLVNPQASNFHLLLQLNILFTVENNGPGLSDEAKNNLFDKFYQADSSHKQEGGGLRLALVKRISAILEGEVVAENLESGGCRFTVILNRN